MPRAVQAMLSAEPLRALILTWRDRAAVVRQEGFLVGADIIERRADELEACLASIGEAELSIAQAAAETGYSSDHLRRYLRENPQLNRGRHGKPKIRRDDLPRKARRSLAAQTPKLYDAAADARSIMSRQGVR